LQGEATPLNLQKAWRVAYVIGLLIAVAWPLALQLMLGTAIRPMAGALGATVRELGYTFTGLTFAAALFITWRSGKVRARFKDLAPGARPGTVLRETVLYAALCELSAVYGILYFALGGVEAERHARAFLALAPIMFLVFTPRLGAWLEAAGEAEA